MPNPAVGTNIGNIYRGQQGNGSATTVGYNPSADIAIANLKQEQENAKKSAEAAKQKQVMDAYKKMGEKVPDNWYVHDKQINQLMEGWRDLGASDIADGNDPFTSQSEKGVMFRKLQTRMDTYVDYSKQFRKEREDVQALFTDAKKWAELENGDEIIQYYANPDLIGMVEAGATAPTPKWREPEIPTYSKALEVLKGWQATNKDRVMGMDDASALAIEMQRDETMSKGFGNTNSKFRQRYNDLLKSLPESERGQFDARGAQNGGVDGYTQYLSEYMFSLSNPSFSIEDEVMKSAKASATRKATVERDGKVISSEKSALSDADVRKIVRGKLQDGAVQREVNAGKYGDPNKNIAFNLKAAEEYYLPIFKKGVSTEYSEKSAREGGAEDAMSEAEWLKAFKGEMGDAMRQEAIDYLRGIKTQSGELTAGSGGEGEVLLRFKNQKGIGDEKTSEFNVEPVETNNLSDEALLKYYDAAKKNRKRGFQAETIPGISPSNKPTIPGF